MVGLTLPLRSHRIGSTPARRLYRQLGFAAAIVVLLVVGTIGGAALYSVIEYRDTTERARLVTVEAHELRSAIKDIESATRGFVITGDEAYLDPYRGAVDRAEFALERLRDLSRDQASYASGLDDLPALVKERITLAQERIVIRRSRGLAEAADPVALDRGRLVTEEIRGHLVEVIGTESEIYDAESAALDREIRHTTIVLAVGLVASAGWLYFLFLLASREAARRRKAEQNLADVNTDLEARVAERTRELGAANDLLQKEVTERERIGEEYRRSSEMLEALIDSAPYAIIGLDTERNVLTWNRAAEVIFGYRTEEVTGRPYPLVPKEDEDEFERYFQRALDGEQLRGVEVKRVRKDGGVIDIRFSGAPLYDESGRPRGVVYALEDVTERRIVNRQLEHAQRMEAIGQLTGGIAHDFNNLLTVVIGNLDLLSERMEDEEANKLASLAIQGAFKGADLTRQLLAFSRQQTLEPEIIDLNELVSGMTQLVRRTLGEQVEVHLHLADDLWPVEADPAQVESAIVNLAINARDAMPNGGRLIIETGNVHLDETYAQAHVEVEPGEYAMIAVSDTGVGIPADQLARVIEPFYTTKAVDKGTGLGLSMIYGFAKQSNGHLKIYSEVGHGTTIKLYLPRLAESRTTPTADVESADVQSVDGAKILVVEDNEDVRATTARQLRDLGYDVIEADRAATALSIMETRDDIDLIFTDVVMPGEMTGFELGNAARALRPTIKILYTSGFAPGVAHAAINHQEGIEFLGKPYLKRSLARKVREALLGE